MTESIPTYDNIEYTENHIITLHSNDAITLNNGSYVSNVIFQFSGLLKPDKNIIRNEIMLVKAEIPNSFYALNYTKNILSYYTTSLKTITVPTGNYNANSFITAITTQFLALGDTFIITFNGTTGKLSFSNSSNNFTFYSSGSTMLTVLGFDPTQNYTSSSNYLSGIYPLNLLPPKRLTVKSNLLSVSNFSSTNKGLDSVIGVIQVNQASYSLITYETLMSASHLLRCKFIDMIDIQILDEYGNFINFNGVDWCLTLLLKTTRNLPQFRNSDIQK